MDGDVFIWILRALVVLVLLIGFGVLLLFSVRATPGRPDKRPSSTRLPANGSRPVAVLPGRMSLDTQNGTEENLRIRSKLYYYSAHVTAVYDGDTVTVDVDLGLGVFKHNQTIRFWKVNTPELRGPDRKRGLEVRDFVRDHVLDQDVLLRTILDKRGEDQTGKFGRLLGEILVEDKHGEIININELLLEKGMATAMDEGGSAVPSTGRAIEEPPSEAPCPFCGQLRTIDPDTAIMEICPNCLDPARPWRG